MTEVAADELKTAVERMHGGKARLAQSVRVRETHQGATVWEGVVHVFELTADRDPRCVVIANRGERQAAVLCRPASAASHIAN
jgi:hypothetical protein